MSDHQVIIQQLFDRLIKEQEQLPPEQHKDIVGTVQHWQQLSVEQLQHELGEAP